MTVQSQPTIKKIEYTHGMVENIGRMKEMDVRLTVDLDEADIPQEVAQSLLSERILHLR
jgi:hypothetical protein